MRRGPRPHSYFQRFRSNFDEDAKTFDGVPVSLKHASRIDSDTSTLLEATLNHMDECFTSVEENVIFTSSAIFDPVTWPEKPDDGDFGNEELLILKDALRLRVAQADPTIAARLEGDEIKDEWEDFLSLVGPHQRRPATFAEVNQRVQMGKQRFPLLSLLLMFIDVIPVQKACVERGFSALNRLKTKGRSSLEEDKLNSSMTITTRGITLEKWSEESALKAIYCWYTHTPETRDVAGHARGSSGKRIEEEQDESSAEED